MLFAATISFSDAFRATPMGRRACFPAVAESSRSALSAGLAARLGCVPWAHAAP
jgi:hypothetical protein